MHANHTVSIVAARPSERVLRRSPLALALAAALMLSAPAVAQVASTQLPTGGSIAGGTGTINAPSGASQVITQTSNRMALTWSTFDIGSAATVTFNQPSSSAAVLNLIQGGNSTQIFGNLNANGQVFLINTNGMIFGSTAQINVGGLVASTLGTTASAFMSGNDVLDAGGNTVSLMSNAGTINAAAGAVDLIGGGVTNSGTITASAGNINLIGADKVTLSFESGGFAVIIDKALQLQLNQFAVDNSGSLIAPGGTISLSARAARGVFDSLVNNSGIVRAAALSGGSDGSVSLVANGAGSNGIFGNGSIDVGSGAISYVSDVGVQQGGVLTAGTVFGSIGGNASFSGANRIANLAFLDVSGNLGLTNTIDLAQQGALTVGGTSTFSLGSQALTLTDGGNDFGGAVSLTSGATRITDSGALTLGTLATGNLTATSTGTLNLGSGRVTGALGATSNNGAIQQAGAGLTVTGTSDLRAGTGAITLTTAANDFQQAVSLRGGATQITDSGALTLGTLATGNLTATSSGALNLGSGAVTGALSASSNGGQISQAGALTVNGTSTLDSGSGSTALTDSGNDFVGALTLTGTGIAVRDANDLTVVGLTNGSNGSIALTAGGALSLPAQAIATGTGNLSLSALGGTLTTPGALSGNQVSLRARDALNLGHSIQAGGNLVLTSDTGAITQTAGLLAVTGTTNATVAAGTGVISLNGTGNDFGGAVSLTGRTALVNDSNALTLGAISTNTLTATSHGTLNIGQDSISGNVTARSNGGAIIQNGAVTMTGPATLDAGSGAISLGNAGNDFQGGLSLVGTGIAVSDRDTLTVTSLTAGSGGDVTLTAGANLVLPTQAIDLGSGNLRLSAQGGALATKGALSANQITLNARDGLALSHDIDADSTLALTATNAAITQGGGAISAGALATVNAGTGAISLLGPGNDFNTGLDLTGSAIGIYDRNDLSIVSLTSAANSAVALTAGGTLSLPAQSIDTGSATLQLRSDTGSLSTAGALRGGTVSLNGRNGITLSHDITTSGNLQLGTTGAALTQLSGTLAIGGTTSVDAGSGAVELNGASNAFTGALSVTGGAVRINALGPLTLGSFNTNALTVRSGGALTFGQGNATTTLTATSASGGITQTGGLAVGGAAQFTAGTDNITLTASDNDFGGAVGLSGNAVQVVDRDRLTLGNSSVGSLLVNSNNTAIDQQGALTVSGSSSFDAGNGSITLTNGANNFTGTVNLSGGAVQVVDANTLTLGNLDTGALTVTSTGALNLGTGSTGALTATSNNGAITQTGALSVNGVGSIDAGSATVALTDIGNHFAGTVNLTGGATQIVDASTLTLGSLNTGALTVSSNGALNLGTGNTGALTATSNNGAITQAGALTVTGASNVNAGSGTIALTDANNEFQGTLGLTGNGIAVTDRSLLQVSSITGNASGDIALTAQTLDLPASAISAGTGSLTLTSTGSAFSTGGALSGANVVLTARDGLTLAHTVNAGNALTLRTTNAAINQTGGQLLVGGATTVNAGSGAIALANANDFTGAVALIGGTTQIVDTSTLTLGTLNTGALSVSSNGALNLGTGNTGALTATSNNGAITQAGALTVTGASNVNAGSGTIALTDANNEFQGTLGLTGNGIAVTDRSLLQVSSITGNASGDIALTAQTLDLPASAISAGTGSLTLTSTGSAFSTGGALSGANVLLTARDGLTLAHTVNAGNALTLRTTTAAIHQTGGQLLVGGATTVNAGSGAIALANANDFTGAVALSGGTTQIVDTNTLTLGTLDTGALSVSSNGALNLGTGSTGALTATSNNGAITQAGALTINGASNLNAGSGSIALNNANNDFVGAVAATGDGIALVDRNDLQLANVQSIGDGAVSLDAGGALLLTSTIDTGSGALDVIARGGTLTTTGALRGGDVQLSGANGIVLGNNLAASGDLALRSNNAAITQSAGTLQVAGNSMVDAGSGAIVLDAAGNDFQGLLALSGGATRVRDADALTLDALNTGALDVASNGALNLGVGLVNGDLDAASNGGAVTQTGALTVIGATRINSAGATIVLADAGNDFQSALSLSGGDTRVRDRNGLTLGTLDVGALDVASGAGLNLGQGRIGGTLVARSGTGVAGITGRLTAQAVVRPAATGADITQQGALTIVGNSVLDAGTGAIVLTDAGNDFQGSVQASGGSIALVDRNDLAAAVQSSGAVNLQAGGQLSSSGAITGSTVTLVSGGAMQLAHDIGSAGTLSLRSGGAITQRAGSLRAAHLSGSAAGAATLTSAGNAIGTLGDFSAQGLDVFSATTLQVSGRVDGGSLLRLNSGGALLLDGQLNGASTWLQAVAGIGQRAGSTLTANLLSGTAGGPVLLGDATTFIDNRVVRLGNFTASNGFSLTNAGDLTLVLSDGSIYSVDAGNSALFLSVRGDLLQEGRATLRDGIGSFSATGGIGTQQNPLYVIGTGTQTIGLVGAPPAYFNATTADGGLLDLSGGSSFNVPASAFAGRAQSSASRTIAFVDLSASGTPYRAFGLVRPGLRLPDDQQPACDAGDPDAVCTPQ